MTKSIRLVQRAFYCLLFIVCFVAATSCSLKLSQYFVSNNKKIYTEQWGNYFINGFHGLVSANYQGVLALGDTQFIFDARGVGSRPNMLPMEPFTIEREIIDSVGISDSKLLKKKLLLVKTTNGAKYEFLLGNADSFYSEMKRWLKEE